MASTYTTNLGFEKPATGEQANTWGDTLRTNWELIEDAISGLTTVSTTGGDTTLTDSDGAVDQSRAAALLITGTLTSAANIIVPAVDKLYDITNSTSGAYSVNIKTSGNDPLSVPQGATVRLRVDSGGSVRFVSNPTSWLADSMAGRGTLTPHSGLVVKTDATNPNYQFDVTADSIVLFDTSGNAKIYASFSGDGDVSASGANGLDTGSEATSTWYYVWVIATESDTKAVMLSTSASSPTMPSGYTYKGLVGAIYNDSGGDFLAFHQIDNEVALELVTPLSDGAATTFTSVDVSAAVPPNAKLICGSIGVRDTNANSAWMQMSPLSSGVGVVYVSQRGASTSAGYAPFRVPMCVSQELFYKVNDADERGFIFISGWSF